MAALMRRLEINAEQLATVAAHAVADLPRECCGVLIGRSEGKRTIVEAVVAAPNAARLPLGRYEIDPQALVAAHRRAREGGLEVVGYYHSHPGGRAVPSRRDRRTAWPETSYLIVATGDGAITEQRSWRLSSSGRFEEQPMGRATASRLAAGAVSRELSR